jgi:hypothetical protein
VGRIADITADRHMEPVRLARWLLAPAPTFRLWRRMKLWELRSYDDVIRMEQDRLTYRAHLRARYGAHWRRKAPVEALLPLRLARWGAPLHPAATDAAPEPVATDVALDPATDAALEPAATDVALNPAALAEPSATRAAVGRICSSGVQRLTVPQRTAAPAKRTAAPAKRAATSGGAAPVKPAAQASAAPQQRSDADAAFTRHADQALVLAGMSKAAAIRALHAAHPEESAPQLVQRLALHGIAAKDSSVRAELARDRQRREAAAAADTEPEPSSGTGHYM